MPRRKLDNTVKDSPVIETSGSAPDPPAACGFKKVLLSGLPPRKSEVKALMKSLEGRGTSRRALRMAESWLQPVADGDALASVLAFSSYRK